MKTAKSWPVGFKKPPSCRVIGELLDQGSVANGLSAFITQRSVTQLRRGFPVIAARSPIWLKRLWFSHKTRADTNDRSQYRKGRKRHDDHLAVTDDERASAEVILLKLEGHTEQFTKLCRGQLASSVALGEDSTAFQ